MALTNYLAVVQAKDEPGTAMYVVRGESEAVVHDFLEEGYDVHSIWDLEDLTELLNGPPEFEAPSKGKGDKG